MFMFRDLKNLMNWAVVVISIARAINGEVVQHELQNMPIVLSHCQQLETGPRLPTMADILNTNRSFLKAQSLSECIVVHKGKCIIINTANEQLEVQLNSTKCWSVLNYCSRLHNTRRRFAIWTSIVQKGKTDKYFSNADIAEINARVTKESALYILMLQMLAWH